jgi:hypothetical protein
MPRNETTHIQRHPLQAYELDVSGYEVARYQLGVVIQRAGAHATLSKRGDGTYSLILADGNDIDLAQAIWALSHKRWHDHPMLPIDGDETNNDPAKLVEQNNLPSKDLAAIRGRYEARWAAINAAEAAGQRTRQLAVANHEESLLASSARRDEGIAKNDAAAALWTADPEDLAEMEERDAEKAAARTARVEVRAVERADAQLEAAADFVQPARRRRVLA